MLERIAPISRRPCAADASQGIAAEDWDRLLDMLKIGARQPRRGESPNRLATEGATA